jgi:hypothetical protein
MQSDYQGHFMRRPRIQAAAISAQHQNNGIVVMVAYALMSGTIVLWMSHLTSVTGSLLSNLNIVSDDHVAFSPTVNRENKADRLPGIRFDDRWSALGKLDTPRPTATIPDPCQPGVRCGGEINLHTKLAVAG